MHDVAVESWGITDKGCVRAQNQDQFLIARLTKSCLVERTSLRVEDHRRRTAERQGHLLLVADGLGGAPAGDLASSLAVDDLVRYVVNAMPWFREPGEESDPALLEELARAIRHCQSRIEAEVQENPARLGMGTTLTLAYVVWPRYYVVHVGDSRCYLLHDAKLRQLTRDHTIAQALAEKGVAQEKDTPWSKVLWNVVGGRNSDLWPETAKGDLEVGDTLLLATDGLSRHVSDAEITKVLRKAASAEAACRSLVDRANEAGGRDNTAVVVARFRPAASEEEGEDTLAVPLEDDDPEKEEASHA